MSNGKNVFLQVKTIVKLIPEDIGEGKIFIAFSVFGSKENYSYSNLHDPYDPNFICEVLSTRIKSESDVLIVLLCAEQETNDKVIILALVLIPVAALEKDCICDKGLISWLPKDTILHNTPSFKLRIHLDTKKAEPFVAPSGEFKSEIFSRMKSDYVDSNSKLKKSLKSLKIKTPPKDHSTNGLILLSPPPSPPVKKSLTILPSSQPRSNTITRSRRVKRAAALIMEQTNPRFWPILGNDDFIRACVELMVEESGGIENQSQNVINYLNGGLGHPEVKHTTKRRSASHRNNAPNVFSNDFDIDTLPRLPEAPFKFKITSDMPDVFNPFEDVKHNDNNNTESLYSNPNAFYKSTPKHRKVRSISDMNVFVSN